MTRLPTLITGGRVFGSRALPSRESGGTARPPVSFIPRTLELAIEAATFSRREPDDDGERVAVFCNALGGSFYYSRDEAERRILKYFPDLAFDGVSAAARQLDSQVRAFLKPTQHDTRRRSSWVHGWMEER